jgi:SpoVK/Ycf46/Vps4 family AAA+-type ATPase
LVLDPLTLAEVHEIAAWAKHERELLDDWGLGRHVKPGFRALFHGPPGTGKTLTATLLGQELGVDVYRVDLSQIVSKYIGETEKNLAAVFAEAGRRKWVLFFDEADALFGKRTQTSSAHDRYANQEIAYLLQRIEEHPGITILATNLKSNLDDAFSRRFQAMVYFALPNPDQRLRLWRNILGPRVERHIDFDAVARDYELSGGDIVNVARRSTLAAVQRGEPAVTLSDLLQGIRREQAKSGHRR